MKSSQFVQIATFGICITSVAWCQEHIADHPNVPIYRVTVTERTVKAVNYQYRSGPTRVDFRGTVLLPRGKGDAIVESKAGRTEIEAHWEHVEAPARYGHEYLTYVLWAITPEGHPKNLGEVLVDGGDHAKLHVTTDLQSFGMIVTAEPYAAVRQPSDVVVMENEIRPDTVGHVEQVQARYELMPRGHYTYEIPAGFPAKNDRAAVPFDRYEEILNVYEAQNAVQIARSMGADRYAPDTFAKAEGQLREAQEFQIRRVDRSTVVTAARRAAQTAEDARAITIKRKQDEEVAAAREQAARANEARARAESEAQRLQMQSSADRMQLQEERAAREAAEREAAAARTVVVAPQPTTMVMTAPASPPPPNTGQRTDERVRLMRDLSSCLPVRDTPRGLVVTVADFQFRDGVPAADLYTRLGRLASFLNAHPGLYLEIDGHTDNSGPASRQDQLSYERANAIRNALVQAGLPANQITARGFGGSRPLVSNASAAGREQNRRVEITIAGDPIGVVPSWDHTYPLVRR